VSRESATNNPTITTSDENGPNAMLFVFEANADQISDSAAANKTDCRE